LAMEDWTCESLMFLLLPNLQQPRFEVTRQTIKTMSSHMKNLSMKSASSLYVQFGSYSVDEVVFEGIRLSAASWP